MDINENQKAVPKTLRVTLNADMLWDSPDSNQRRQALRSKIAQMLGEEETSPLLGRVVVGENESSPIKCITVEAIQNALKKCQFFTQFGKKNIIISDGTFDLGEDLQATCDLFYRFIEECLIYIKKYTENEWAKSDTESGIIAINRGIQALIRVINDIVNMLVERKTISIKSMKVTEIMDEVTYYLDPLIEYLNKVSHEQRKDLRGYFGAGADTRFWRAFQKAIADIRYDFCPDKLNEYWIDQAKTYNDESISLLREIEKTIKHIISESLKATLGDNWIITGLPRSVYSRANREATDQNYENISKGSNGLLVSIWECVTLAECKMVITNGKNWSEVFEDTFTRPQDKKMSGGKESKTDWITRLSSINNKLSKASYSVTTEEYSMIKEVYDWIKQISSK